MEDDDKTRCTSLAHRGNNMERFIVGRQILDVLIVFVTNMCDAVVAGAEVVGLSAAINDIFLSSGLALALTKVCHLGTAHSASQCRLLYARLYHRALCCSRRTRPIELSGALHFTYYLVQILVSRIAD
mmetsp:Transcript_29325/g.65058  ORF Transcript_29325/g.65058 Transcript_29325/m.65058 type:complete len:128 (-) Transcript_29325:3-386(-)